MFFTSQETKKNKNWKTSWRRFFSGATRKSFKILHKRMKNHLGFLTAEISLENPQLGSNCKWFQVKPSTILKNSWSTFYSESVWRFQLVCCFVSSTVVHNICRQSLDFLMGWTQKQKLREFGSLLQVGQATTATLDIKQSKFWLVII